MSLFDAAVATLNDGVISEFSDPMTWTPTAGSPFSVPMIEKDPSFLEGIAPGQNRAYWVRLSDFPTGSPSTSDSVTISSATYRVIQVLLEPDGGGGATVILTKS